MTTANDILNALTTDNELNLLGVAHSIGLDHDLGAAHIDNYAGVTHYLKAHTDASGEWIVVLSADELDDAVDGEGLAEAEAFVEYGSYYRSVDAALADILDADPGATRTAAGWGYY